ncbi:hypothetical protein ACFL6M_05595 [Candidatus Eisenbacteria bacterium]|uniref:Uncharacterized protein n=1 Tax=Eiseniibacteriota bacterium TaxID=2212470 RepID=A0ABV6YL54_UNCEI
MSFSGNSGVILRKEMVDWGAVPRPIGKALVESTERIARLRIKITRAAKIRSMPPVHIVPQVWVTQDDSINGCATPLFVRNEIHMGVVIPAQTALCRDFRLVRRILVHEFAHCFAILTRVIDHLDSGRSGGPALPQRQSLDDTCAEVALLVLPDEWFGRTDARDFFRWKNPDSEAFAQTIEKLDLTQKLPTGYQLPEAFQVNGNLAVPSEITKHVRRLRRSRRHVRPLTRRAASH